MLDVFESSSIKSAVLCYYPLKGDLKDYSKQGRPDIIGNCIFSPGKYGRAAYPDSNNSFKLSITNLYYSNLGNRARPPVGRYAEHREATISFWIKIKSEGNGVARILCHDENETIIEITPNNELIYHLKLGGYQDNFSVKTTPLKANVWHHIAVTIKYESAIKFYVNGRLQQSITLGKAQSDYEIVIAEVFDTKLGKLYLFKDGDQINYSINYTDFPRPTLHQNYYTGHIERKELNITDEQFDKLDNSNISSWEEIINSILLVTSARGHTMLKGIPLSFTLGGEQNCNNYALGDFVVFRKALPQKMINILSGTPYRLPLPDLNEQGHFNRLTGESQHSGAIVIADDLIEGSRTLPAFPFFLTDTHPFEHQHEGKILLTHNILLAEEIAKNSEPTLSIGDIVNKIVALVGKPARANKFVSREDIGIDESTYIHLDIGGEGYYANNFKRVPRRHGYAGAINVNEKDTYYLEEDTNFKIQNLVQINNWDKDPSYPFADGFADEITIQNVPLTDKNVSEIARCLRPGGTVSFTNQEECTLLYSMRVLTLNGFKPDTKAILYVEINQDGDIHYMTAEANGRVIEGIIKRSELLGVTDEQFRQLDNHRMESFDNIKESILDITAKRGDTFNVNLFKLNVERLAKLLKTKIQYIQTDELEFSLSSTLGYTSLFSNINIIDEAPEITETRKAIKDIQVILNKLQAEADDAETDVNKTHETVLAATSKADQLKTTANRLAQIANDASQTKEIAAAELNAAKIANEQAVANLSVAENLNKEAEAAEEEAKKADEAASDAAKKEKIAEGFDQAAEAASNAADAQLMAVEARVQVAEASAAPTVNAAKTANVRAAELEAQATAANAHAVELEAQATAANAHAVELEAQAAAAADFVVISGNTAQGLNELMQVAINEVIIGLGHNPAANVAAASAINAAFPANDNLNLAMTAANEATVAATAARTAATEATATATAARAAATEATVAATAARTAATAASAVAAPAEAAVVQAHTLQAQAIAAKAAASVAKAATATALLETKKNAKEKEAAAEEAHSLAKSKAEAANANKYIDAKKVFEETTNRLNGAIDAEAIANQKFIDASNDSAKAKSQFDEVSLALASAKEEENAKNLILSNKKIEIENTNKKLKNLLNDLEKLLMPTAVDANETVNGANVTNEATDATVLARGEAAVDALLAPAAFNAGSPSRIANQLRLGFMERSSSNNSEDTENNPELTKQGERYAYV